MRKIIIHCSDSTWGNAAEIDHWHRTRKPKPFARIGYHFVILNGRPASKHEYALMYDGVLETGRHINDSGAHCYGHNSDIGICLIGKSGTFTTAQVEALADIIIELDGEIEIELITQHSDHDKNKPHCAGLPSDYIKYLNNLTT